MEGAGWGFPPSSLIASFAEKGEEKGEGLIALGPALKPHSLSSGGLTVSLRSMLAREWLLLKRTMTTLLTSEK